MSEHQTLKKQVNYIHKRFLKIIYILLIVSVFLISSLYFTTNEVQAAQSTAVYKNSSSVSGYPGYATLIDKLKKEHPNWTFTILYTGLDWNQVLKKETTALHGRNLIDGEKTGAWVCSQCGDDKYDNGTWKCASEATVAYYMDPRNSLNEDYIFQFEDLTWKDGIYTTSGINKILSDCKYMQGSTIKYRKTNGSTGTINKSYAEIIMAAGKKYKISPYHLAARIRQEQGPGSKASSTATGTYSDTYEGYYNFFNIGATGESIITNALKYAKNKGWTDPEKSIMGGAKFVAEDYVGRGQKTLYLQKFDVENSDGSLYSHQYMQNVSAAKSEGTTMKSAHSSLNKSFNFIIPVYKNMPDAKCPMPGSQNIVTQNVQVTASTLYVRSSRSTSASVVATLKKGAKILRIEIGSTKTNGYYWDKVVLDNGKQGYVATNYIKLLDDITNCDIRAVATEPGNLRNGPGTSGTTVITTLSVGQYVTIIEKNKYKNISGENWSRIVLSDGRQGYIVARYLEEVSSGGSTSSGSEIVKVVCDIGLSIREEPTTKSDVLKAVPKGEYLTRTKKNVKNADGYIWDAVTTDDGISGYVARGDEDENYIEPVSGNSSTTIKGSGFKTSGTSINCNPSVTVSSIKKAAPDAIIKNTSGTQVTSGKLGTGYTVKLDGRTYTVRKKGDPTGDGSVTSADYVRVKNYLRGKSSLNANQLYAADANGDGNVTSADYVRIKNYLRGKASISI